MGVADGQQPVVGRPGQGQRGAARLAGQQLGLPGPQVEQVEVGQHLPVLGGDSGNGQLGAVGRKGHPHGDALGGGGAPGQQFVAAGVVNGQQGQLAHVVGDDGQLAPVAEGAQIDMPVGLAGIQLPGAALHPQLAARAVVQHKAVFPRRQGRPGVAGADGVQPAAPIRKDGAALRAQHHETVPEALSLVDLPRAGLLREPLLRHQGDADAVGHIFQQHDRGVHQAGQVDDCRRHERHQQNGAPQPAAAQTLPRRLDVFDPARGHFLPAGPATGLSHPSASFP